METQSNPEELLQQQDENEANNQTQKIFTNYVITSNRKSYASFSSSSIQQSSLSTLLEAVLAHILSEQLIEIKQKISVDKCDIELFCQKLFIQQIKDLITTQDSSKLCYQQLQHYQHYQNDIELIKQSIEPKKLKLINQQCSKLLTTYKSLQLLINKFKVQIYATSIDGELSRLQCFHLLEKVQAELLHMTKYGDIVKEKLAERNEIQQFLFYPIKDVYKQEIRKQFCSIFLQKEQQQQRIEIFLQPTLTVNKKLTSSRQATSTLFRPAKHLQSISNDTRTTDENLIKSKITQHFASMERQKIPLLMHQKSAAQLSMRINQSNADPITINILEAVYLLIQTNFIFNDLEEVLEKNNRQINTSQLQHILKQLKSSICQNIFNQLITSQSFKLNEELFSQEMKSKCKSDIKIMAEFFAQEKIALINQKIFQVNTRTNQYLNQLTGIIYAFLENYSTNIKLDTLYFHCENPSIPEKVASLIYGQSLLMIKFLQCKNPMLLVPLSNYLSQTSFLEQQQLLYPFQQQMNSLNKQINQVMLHAQNESISSLLFETYICIISKHVIDRREQYCKSLNMQTKVMMKEITQLIQGKQLKQQLLSYSDQKTQLFELNDVGQTIEWLFDQHILKKHIIKSLDSIDEFSFFIQQIIAQCKALFEEDFFNENIKFNRISSQLQLFENYVRQEILKKSNEQQLKILWSNKIFRLFHKLNNEYLPSSRATTRRKQITEPRQMESQTAFQSPTQTKPVFLRQSIFVKGNKTLIQQTERCTQSILKIKESKEYGRKII